MLINNYIYSTDIDECQISPCQNNATCTSIDGVNGYSCECVAGYTGDDCETGKYNLI